MVKIIIRMVKIIMIINIEYNKNGKDYNDNDKEYNDNKYRV